MGIEIKIKKLSRLKPNFSTTKSLIKIKLILMVLIKYQIVERNRFFFQIISIYKKKVAKLSWLTLNIFLKKNCQYFHKSHVGLWLRGYSSQVLKSCFVLFTKRVIIFQYVSFIKYLLFFI